MRSNQLSKILGKKFCKQKELVSIKALRQKSTWLFEGQKRQCS